MSVNAIITAIDKVSSHDWRTKFPEWSEYNKAIEDIVWEECYQNIISQKKWTKQSLLIVLNNKLDTSIDSEIMQPQRQVAQEAIDDENNIVKKVERLALNAKLHLLKHNTLLNNIQLAFSHPEDYIELDPKKIELCTPQKKEEEHTRAIQKYVVIDPQKTQSILQKLWLQVSIDDIITFKHLLSHAQLHTYQTQSNTRSYKLITTPRITYINGYPMLFGKNLVHVLYGHNSTKAEQSKYDIDTSAKIFNNFYSLIRAHEHIQASEQQGIQALTELNTLFAQGGNVVKNKEKYEELKGIIEEIIENITNKKDSKVTKAKNQDLKYILDSDHTIRNDNKLQAARNKIKERIIVQQEIKHKVAQQQQALDESLRKQIVPAKQYITELQQHINHFDVKKRSARDITLTYEKELFAKPFYDLHDHLIKLDDQAKKNNRLPTVYKEKIAIDLLLQRWQMIVLLIEDQQKKGNKNQPIQHWMYQLQEDIEALDCDKSDKAMYFDPCIQIFEEIQNDPDRDQITADTRKHMHDSWKTLIEN